MIMELKSFIRLQRKRLLRNVLRIFSDKLAVSNKKTLIIAPHPDDETFGCGGLIAQKIQNGTEVFVLFLTSGEKSLKTVLEKEIKQMRRQSATEAVRLLGVNESNLFWFDFPDGEIPRQGNEDFKLAKAKMAKIVNSMNIEEIVAPHYLEGWSDHLAAYELAVEMSKESKQNIDLYLYWVWAWYYMEIKQMVTLPWRKMRLLSIKSVFIMKSQALDVYFGSKTKNGELYMGNLPKVFLKAFKWPYEVYEKVNIDEV